MSTFSTAPEEFAALPSSDFEVDPDLPRGGQSTQAPWKRVRVSTDLATGDVAVDVETPDRYDRSVLSPADARSLGELLIKQASYSERL